MVPCPLCDAEIDIDATEIDEGDIVTCDDCGADLRVTGLDPIEIESLDDEEEDEDFLEDDDDEEEEEWK